MCISKTMECVRWAFNIRNWQPSRSDWLLAASCVQQEEKDRIGRFVFTSDAKSAMAGRLLIRKYICDNLHVPYKEIKLSRTEKGKPFLINSIGNKKVDFSISHHGDYAVLAADLGEGVGIDVMKIEHNRSTGVHEFFRLMKKQFSPEEWSCVTNGSTEDDQLHLFYRHWCLKESYLKAEGVGLIYDLHNVSFTLPTLTLSIGQYFTDTILHVDGMLYDKWLYEETLLDKKHCIAVAVDKKVVANRKPPLFTNLSFKQLVENVEPMSEPDIPYYETFALKTDKP